jgi:hypothetical protein
VRAPLDQLTGYLDFAIGDVELRSSVGSRLETEATWTNMTGDTFETCP